MDHAGAQVEVKSTTAMTNSRYSLETHRIHEIELDPPAEASRGLGSPGLAREMRIGLPSTRGAP